VVGAGKMLQGCFATQPDSTGKNQTESKKEKMNDDCWSIVTSMADVGVLCSLRECNQHMLYIVDTTVYERCSKIDKRIVTSKSALNDAIDSWNVLYDKFHDANYSDELEYDDDIYDIASEYDAAAINMVDTFVDISDLVRELRKYAICDPWAWLWRDYMETIGELMVENCPFDHTRDCWITSKFRYDPWLNKYDTIDGRYWREVQSEVYAIKCLSSAFVKREEEAKEKAQKEARESKERWAAQIERERANREAKQARQEKKEREKRMELCERRARECFAPLKKQACSYPGCSNLHRVKKPSMGEFGLVCSVCDKFFKDGHRV
jgi:hypothetical protein